MHSGGLRALKFTLSSVKGCVCSFFFFTLGLEDPAPDLVCQQVPVDCQTDDEPRCQPPRPGVNVQQINKRGMLEPRLRLPTSPWTRGSNRRLPKQSRSSSELRIGKHQPIAKYLDYGPDHLITERPRSLPGSCRGRNRSISSSDGPGALAGSQLHVTKRLCLLNTDPINKCPYRQEMVV